MVVQFQGVFVAGRGGWVLSQPPPPPYENTNSLVSLVIELHTDVSMV